MGNRLVRRGGFQNRRGEQVRIMPDRAFLSQQIASHEPQAETPRAIAIDFHEVGILLFIFCQNPSGRSAAIYENGRKQNTATMRDQSLDVIRHRQIRSLGRLSHDVSGCRFSSRERPRSPEPSLEAEGSR